MSPHVLGTRPHDLRDSPFAAHNRYVRLRFQGQSAAHPVTNTCQVYAWFGSAEDYVLCHPRSARQEYPPHQTSNLFVREVHRVPITGLTKDVNSRQRSFSCRRRPRFETSQYFGIRTHLISFTRIAACPFLPVTRPIREFPNTPRPLPVSATRGLGNPPRTPHRFPT